MWILGLFGSPNAVGRRNAKRLPASDEVANLEISSRD